MSSENSAVQAEAASDIEQGTYEILHRRLLEQSDELKTLAEQLNQQRLELFGGTEMTVIGNERIRTENNCVPRDIRTIGDVMLFGYNVFIGLRTEIQVQDVFSLHTFERTETGFEFALLPPGDERNFLVDPKFIKDFQELYKYYKETRLRQIRRIEGKLLAIFQIGASVDDTKVFRWLVDNQGRATYIDNRGERDDVFPSSHDFEWIITDREQHVLGRHPHVSILDEVFVEAVGGDLTVKVEDNTEDGQGIYRELVDDANQSLADAEIHYAKVGTVILIKILPYNEMVWRHLVFNTRTQQVVRLDAIGLACQLLPEDHGLIFPGGYYLQSGETKTFEGDTEDMEFKRALRSPNGEDVLYVFHERSEGRSILLNYNLIRKQVASPIHCHGMANFEDGNLVVFRALSDEPTRVHQMQIWQTPFVSDEFAARAPSSGSFLEKVGNAELVRGISDALSVCRSISEQEATVQGFEDLIAATVRMQDSYYWLDAADVGDLASPLRQVRATGDLIIGEFEKVQAIQQRAQQAVAENETAIEELFHRLRATPRNKVDHYVQALADLRTQRGKLISLREVRRVDLQRVDKLEQQIVDRFSELSGQTVEFLLADGALAPYHQQIEELVAKTEKVRKTKDAQSLVETLTGIGDGLELLTEVVGGLEIDDATQRTRILEAISEVLSSLNRGRALVEARRRELLKTEGVSEFGAQFQLLTQSVAGALALADSPEKCDEQLSKLMLQLEDLEGRFGEFDEFLDQLSTKREDVYEAFSSKKQTLLDQRQRRVSRMMQAAQRILEGIGRRASSLSDNDALNTYFVGDAMVSKVRDLSDQLRTLGDSVKADELDSRLKSTKEDASRSLRDRQDIYEDGATVIKLGRHRFSVNTQASDLTMVPRADAGGQPAMAFHLTGTDFFAMIEDVEFQATQEYWDQLLVSETTEVYRGEYLAASILFDAEEQRAGLSLERLQEAVIHGVEAAEGGLLQLVRSYAAERYDEGYERGSHDHDATLILDKLLSLYVTAGLLRFAPRPRALACLFWAFFTEQTSRVQWQRRALSLARLRSAFSHSTAINALVDELGHAIESFFTQYDIDIHGDEAHMAGAYLFEELTRNPVSFATSAEAEKLRDAFYAHLDLHQNRRDFDEDLRELSDDLSQRYRLALAWMTAFVGESEAGESKDQAAARLRPSLEESVVLLLTVKRLDRTVSSAQASYEVSGLLGQHPRIDSRSMTLRLDEYLARLVTFRQTRVPGFRKFQELRHGMLERQKRELRLDEYQPKVMSAFVRNRLISEVYLPIIGDNLAKQMGALGADKRTDQMGLLLLISPPGYGKTTLMEYVANRLGLIFVKVNGPSLGHGVTSIDPTDSPNATARQEVEKINFALEMGNNVLLYLDDIQHTHPELLQKFISLCDAQRRIEGVWQGRTRTYDLKGKRFAICMAGNPYTESGEAFQIPDMLANRADTYNLGDILDGKEEVFALSYIENALTSNRALAPLTTHDPEDLFKLVRMARGEALQADQLSHDYSQVELEEILNVLRMLLRVQDVVLQVNQQYIASAAQEDAFRSEPRFQLQGSYRNMNKMAEKVVAVMNEHELEAMIDDHYVGEAQTLTTGAEANLLKLKDLRGTLEGDDAERWEAIRRGFARVQAMGGAEDDPAVRLIGQLGLVSDRLAEIDRAIHRASEVAGSRGDAQLQTLAAVTERASQQPESGAESAIVVGPQFSEALEPYLQHLKETVGALASSRQESQGQTAMTLDLAPIGERLDTFLGQLAELVGEVAATAAKTVAAGPLPAPPAREPSAPEPSAPESASAAAPSPNAGAATLSMAAPPSLAGADFGPYLEKLNETLVRMSESTAAARVVQTLGGGVHEVLDSLSETVSGNLLPLVQALDTQMKDQGITDRRLRTRIDRSLQNLDRMKDLLASLRKIDTRGLVVE